MDWLAFYRCIFILVFINYASAESFYTITAPSVVRPDSEYHVAVSTAGISTISTVFVELSGDLDNGERFSASQTVEVLPYSKRIARLEIGETSPGTYRLSVRSLSGIEFSNSTTIEYIHKSYSTFIITDRAIYKPGTKVLFRCIVLDSNMRPSLTRQLDVYIVDGSGNRIKQWSRPPLTRGIFSGELELSEFPVLGEWKIVANVAGQTFEKDFTVAEYVLPKFEVTIDAPEHLTFKEGKIPVSVSAKYTYGKPVKGEATITAYPDIFSGIIQPIFQSPVRKVLSNFTGKATVDFDIMSELRLSDDYERPIMIDVAVEEALTGRRQNTSMKMTLYKHKYTMELIKTSEYYKPGLKYTAFIKLAYHDGSPVRDNKNPVLIAYGYTYNPSAYFNMTKMLDVNGMIQLDFYPAKSENNLSLPLNIEAQYLNFHQWFPQTNQAMSRSNEYIQATLITEEPSVNSDIVIEVNSTSPLKYLNYEVLARGDIVDVGSFNARGNSTVTFHIFARSIMAPTAHIIVYYLLEDGEVIADALDVELKGALQNFVDIQVTPGETEPGDDVSLLVSSKPNSYIGLLGVDQRSLLLKSGNDISLSQVMKELRSYDNVEESPYSDLDFGRSFWRPGSGTADDVFKKSGVTILTNGYVHENFPLLYYRSSLDGVMFATAAAGSAPATFPSEKVKVRKNFPETWLWQTLDAGPEGRTELRRAVPDSITSWILTAFSVNDVHGLGLIEQPRKLKVFRPFFLSMDLPYSVIRGETVAIPIVVFNYMNKDLICEVLLENADEFEFAEVSNDVNDAPKLEVYRKKQIEVKANSGSSVSFLIIPQKLGYITIKAIADGRVAKDIVEHKLLVKAEGETQYRNRAIFIDLRNQRSLKTNISVDIPKNAVSGSEHVEISAVGDILGPSIPNLANLIKMPSGCGEQNMLNFVPNIVILNYLRNTNQLTPAIQSKALKYLEIGYQQELTYRHKDGSFSAFGMSDASGSTWLTAFVAKSFKQAAQYVAVEDRIINDALTWLSNNQAANGSFPEVGKVSHRDMQGGAAKGLALTAFTLIAFLEKPDSSDKFRNTINKGVNYVIRNMEDLDERDVYALSLCTYVLNLARHSYEVTAFNMLQNAAKTENDFKWWSKPTPSNNKNPWYSLPRSVDVEMTSYALLTYLNKNLLTDSIDIMKWMVKQRNSEGGFASTQDTVIGIYALAKLGERLASRNNDIRITFTYEDGGKNYININSGNVMILQKHLLPKKTRLVNITASGTGFALVQVSSQYNLNVTGAWPLFTLDPQVDKNSNANHLQLSICSGFVPTKEANESNMAVMEVSLPSGFTVDRDTLPSLEVSQNVKRVETRNGDTMVVLYFDKMVRQEYCPTVSAFRTHKVVKQKPVPVSIYDYYDSSRRARVFYEPRATTIYDLCEDEDFSDLCTTQSGKQKHDNDIHSAGSRTENCSLLMIILFYIMLRKYL